MTCKGIIVGYSQDFESEPIGDIDFILVQEYSFLFVPRGGGWKCGESV
jgi:hypothetical protein